MIKPLRVIHVVRKMDMGGIELMLMNYYRNINRNLLQFDFIVQTNEEGYFDEEIKSLGGEIYNVTSMASSLRKYKKETKKILSEYNYRIVHIHHNFANIHAAIEAKRIGTECIISHSHSTYLEASILKRIIKKTIQYRLNKIVDYRFACSLEAGEWLYGKKQIVNENVIIMNNAIDIDDFRYSNFSRIKIRQELGLSDEFVIGHVGSFNRVKNHDFLIDIFMNIYKENSNSILVLVGDGNLKEDIHNKIKRLGIEDQVFLLGNRSDVGDLMSSFDVLLFPSKFEGLGTVLIEAQTAGLQCVTSTNVPKESDITGLVDFVSLEKKAEYWAKKSLKYSDNYTRKDTSKIITENGYNIKKESQIIEGFYLNQVD